MKIKVLGVQCPVCDQIIVSRYTHDFQECECMYSSVDGGRDYFHIVWGCSAPINEEFDIDKHARIMQEFNQYIGVPKTVKVLINV